MGFLHMINLLALFINWQMHFNIVTNYFVVRGTYL